MPTAAQAEAPIGVFDSGVGGLSVLRALRAQLPQENFVYLSDAAHAPYGERTDDYLTARALRVADYLIGQRGVKSLVVACNTATAAAIEEMRARWPALPIVGIEPALKPAAAASQTKRVGVMATRSTLQSAKFNKLLDSLQDQAQFVVQACDGLAAAIENGDDQTTRALCERYLHAMGDFGQRTGQIDQLVLGCTHYPLVSAVLQSLAGPGVELLEAGAPVSLQTRRVLDQAQLLFSRRAEGLTQLLSTGPGEPLGRNALRWLGLDLVVESVQTGGAG
ncbi:MAG: glutamate racemase [Betaproteobacteria bacterium]|nr:glutamate racemase [Betaproteobacteria bacterium]